MDLLTKGLRLHLSVGYFQAAVGAQIGCLSRLSPVLELFESGSELKYPAGNAKRKIMAKQSSLYLDGVLGLAVSNI